MTTHRRHRLRGLASLLAAFAFVAAGCASPARQAAPATDASIASPSPPATPDAAYPELFAAVQDARLFEDQKLFADAIPREAPASIRAAYRVERTRPGFDLRRFVANRFLLPPPVDATQVRPRGDLRAHIDALWPLLTRRSPTPAPYDSLLPLPNAYVVPGGRFREIYYWDSYFTMLGLVESGETRLSRAMLGNFASLIDAHGHVPNGNRSYYLSRSQPPYFSHMVALEARDDPSTWRRHLPQLRREHAFWMEGADGLAPGQAHRRVVRLHDGSLLNRHWDDRDVPRPESYLQDRETAAASDRPPAGVYRDLRAAAESGWDFSSRWLDDPSALHTIRTTAIVPVDLNSLLHHLETSIAHACTLDAQHDCASHYTALAEDRRRAIETHLWHDAGYYTDYDWQRRTRRDAPTAAMLSPLFVGIASPGRAARTAATVRERLLRRGGLATTTIETGQQWDAPNAWAPLQWIAVSGLRRYGEDALAREIAARFIDNVRTVFEREHKLVEKYDAEGPRGGGGGEYPLQDGFGWSNGVVRRLLALYPDLDEAGSTR